MHATCELYADTEALVQSLAHKDINAFVEYVGKNERGKSVVQGQIHKEIQNHIDECKRRGFKNCGILAPWGHGKTEQIIFRTLDEIGKNVNIRAQIICNTDDNSRSRVTSLQNYIENDDEYHKIYPHVRKGTKAADSWGKHKLMVERDSKSKDGTIEAWGITTSGTGSRADLQIFDDPVDMRNAILNPAMREQVKESFKNVWMSRLVPSGFRIYIATVWHEDDLTHELMANDEWHFLKMMVSEDFSRIECESCFKGNYEIDLWKIWNEKELRTQIKTIGQRAFDRGYRQKALSDEDRTFPSSESIFRWDLDKSFINPHWPRVIGVDPFGQNVVIFTMAISHRGQYVPVDIKCGKFAPKKTIDYLIEAWLKHRPQIIVVENNAAQEAICQWALEVGYKNMPIAPFTTGSVKNHPEFGLPAMEVEFANGTWVVPMKGIDEFDSKNPFNLWRKELRSHPVGAAEDTIMASWFAREGARFLKFGEEPDPEIVDEEDMNVEHVNIGDYD